MTKLDVAFRFHDDGVFTVTPLGFELYPNTPNPWSSKTQIRFYLPAAGEARLTVFDETGKVLVTQKHGYEKGYNGISLDRNQLPESGVFFYRLETASGSAVQKMVVL